MKPLLPEFAHRPQGGGTAPVDERAVFTAVVFAAVVFAAVVFAAVVFVLRNPRRVHQAFHYLAGFRVEPVGRGTRRRLVRSGAPASRSGVRRGHSSTRRGVPVAHSTGRTGIWVHSAQTQQCCMVVSSSASAAVHREASRLSGIRQFSGAVAGRCRRIGPRFGTCRGATAHHCRPVASMMTAAIRSSTAGNRSAADRTDWGIWRFCALESS